MDSLTDFGFLRVFFPLIYSAFCILQSLVFFPSTKAQMLMLVGNIFIQIYLKGALVYPLTTFLILD